MTRTPAWLFWSEIVAASLGLAAVAWALLTETGGVLHGHPAYLVMLAVTALVAVTVIVLSIMRRRSRPGWRRGLRGIAVVLGLLWVLSVAWLRPFTAISPALEAMEDGGAVAVSETATAIVLEPVGDPSPVGVFFQPGALVDARAYAAVLRPLAEGGHTVVIPKQPLGIAFFATGAFDSAREAHPDVNAWVAGGHSLGGVVATISADAADADATAPAVGLLLFGSYPAGDVSGTLETAVESISGTRDGLSTPEDIEASRANLPEDAQFTVIEGASHAQFGDYGPQPGDGEPLISDDEARSQISAAAVAFVDRIAAALEP
ncbi:alpha/beta hydrolase [uncultured Demequina sp.]|uniref:alpha/beta hydrolase n=1 Tax=uncultured Demequina sp. TaxID=693499 RepID=UPI0025F74890|nr:alpha/beta hydrolase [uncultured Demequina sp.]